MILQLNPPIPMSTPKWDLTGSVQDGYHTPMKTTCGRCNGSGETDTLSGRYACDTCCGVGYLGQDDELVASSPPVAAPKGLNGLRAELWVKVYAGAVGSPFSYERQTALSAADSAVQAFDERFGSAS